MSYRPKFTISSRLSSQIDEITLMQEKIVTAHGRLPSISAFQKGETRHIRPPRNSVDKLFTLEKVIALANGRDFPVVTERSEPQVLTYFAERFFIGRKSGKVHWAHKDVFKLHKILVSGDVMNHGPAGRYRTIAVRAGEFVPPRSNKVFKLMSEFLEWWNTMAPKLPAVLTSAIVHYRISHIHPFLDGNGRLGRALAVWELNRNGFDTCPIFSLNESYWGERRHYYAALRAVSRQSEDLTTWLEYSAEELRLALERKWRVAPKA